MLILACVGLWLSLCVSFALAASIIGMPFADVLYEILRFSFVPALALGAYEAPKGFPDARDLFMGIKRSVSQRTHGYRGPSRRA